MPAAITKFHLDHLMNQVALYVHHLGPGDPALIVYNRTQETWSLSVRPVQYQAHELGQDDVAAEVHVAPEMSRDELRSQVEAAMRAIAARVAKSEGA